MSVIHMEPEDVRSAAKQIDLAAGDLYSKPSKMRRIATSLRSAWQGGEAAEYASELRRLAGILHNEVITLQRLAQRLRTEVDEWERADSLNINVTTVSYLVKPSEGGIQPEAREHSQPYYREELQYTIENGTGGMMLTTGAVAGGGAVLYNIQYGDGQHEFNWWEVGGGSVDITDGIIELLELTKIVDKAPWVKGLPILSFGLGVASDLQDGDSMEQAVASEAIEAGIKLLPGIGWVFMGWDFVLGSGHLVGGLVEVMGYSEMAERFQNNWDKLDVLDSFADHMAESIREGRKKPGLWNITSMTTMEI